MTAHTATLAGILINRQRHRRISRLWVVRLALLAGCCCPVSTWAEPPGTRVWEQTAAMPAPEASQAAAADGDFVYAITNDRIGKYERTTGRRVALSTGEAHHLNSGFFWQGKLYCAHSNYPRKPERMQKHANDL